MILNLENLHPDFCLTFDNLWQFTWDRVELISLPANYCTKDVGNIRDWARVCIFYTLEKLPTNCYGIIGDVEVDVNSGTHLYKLFGVVFIFGSLKIQYMKAEGLDFMYKLAYVIAPDAARPAILIRSNKYLKNAILASLEVVTRRFLKG